MEELNITLKTFEIMVDILMNILNNLKENDKFDGMRYLMVSIQNFKIKWSSTVQPKAITASHSSDHNDRYVNIFNSTKDQPQFLFKNNKLNTVWISKFFNKVLSEFVFENFDNSLLSNGHRALTYDREATQEARDDRNQSSEGEDKSIDTSVNAEKESHRKKVKSKKKQTFKCVLCDKRYLQRKPLLKHFSRFHIGFCSECGVNTGSKIEDIIDHKRAKHSKKYAFICDICGEVFSRNQQFQIHLQIHERDSKNAKTITCPECNETFTKKYLYRKHLQLTKHQDRSMICEQCGTQFNDSVKLNQHIKRVHNGITRKCQYCDQTFDQKCNLDRHMRLHTQVEKQFICEHCGDAYYTNEAVRQHCITAHEQKPKVACSICQKEFKNSRSLRIHIASHSDQRPFTCTRCPQAFKLKFHLSRHEKSVHGQLPIRKKLERLQPNEKGELVAVTESPPCNRRPKDKLTSFQPFSNDSLFYSHEKEFTTNTMNGSNNNIIGSQLNDVQHFQLHQNNTNISDYVMDMNLDIFHNCDAQHQGQANFSFTETPSINQQCYTENRHLNELDQNNWSNFIDNGAYDNKNDKMPIIELNSSEYMQISVPPIMQYQNAWHSDNTQMDISAGPSSQKITYNNIGNILTNLELLGNNSNFDASNFEIITPSNHEQQSKVMLSDVNAASHNGMSYFDIQPIQQNTFNDLSSASNLQNHTITDISNTYVTETQRNHLHQTRFFQNREVLHDNINKSHSHDAVESNPHQTAIVFPSLTDYLPNSSTHGFN